ncbi:hypothetical protein Cgig2_004921 [Carnegiea gigantea]|uniref:Uncharacterized protein n=1 Tax=Carnegiea gigantea TaxID=171969 RepID=A0A9Q1KZ69_9CARY|nr:hypothetical protein Cgig2_004921 [Carnegiea gigantea]
MQKLLFLESYTLAKRMVRVDLSCLHDFDVHSLYQPQIAEANVFHNDVEENLGEADDEESDQDDRKDSDFRDFLLDEENDLELENESLDDIDLETDTQLLFKQGKLWTRSSDEKGIIKALKNVMLQASRRICVLYFYKNFASNYPSMCIFNIYKAFSI